MKGSAAKLVTLSDPQGPTAEAYRTLRTNIHFSTQQSPLRSLLVTSAGPDEGKSMTLCNLAVTFAQAGTKLIVVDSNLRHPSIHEVFDLANDKGLATALLDEQPRELPLQPTMVPNLQVLTSGPLPPNPTDLLASRRMRQLIESLVASAELVLFDSPPVALVADAAILAHMLDGVILVISAGRTRRDMAIRAKSILEKASARVLGVVLNNAEQDANLDRYFGIRTR